MWMAPNLLTLIGWFAVVIPTCGFVLTDPTFTQELPRWMYYMAAVGVWVYETFDGIDGK